MRTGRSARIPVQKDHATHRAKLGSSGGRPPVFDRERYKERNTVESRVNKLRQHRAVATRFDKRQLIYQGTGSATRPVTSPFTIGIGRRPSRLTCHNPGMFVVTVTYTAPLKDVDQWRPAHGEWLNDLITRRLLLVAGRQVPLVGGVYLTTDMPAEELAQILATDPYVLNNVATHSVVEFTPLLLADGLESLKN